jgi:hypothetical protein
MVAPASRIGQRNHDSKLRIPALFLEKPDSFACLLGVWF